MLLKAEESEELQQSLMQFCSQSILFWVNLFAFTFNVKAVDEVGREKPAVIQHVPFITWPVQDEAFLELQNAVDQGYDVIEDKSRDMGASWIDIALAEYYWLFRANSHSLMASRVEDLVDKQGDPDCLFWKIDYINRRLPAWMLPGPGEAFQREGEYRTHMQLTNPLTQSTIAGTATTALKLPVSLQIVLRALIEEGATRLRRRAELAVETLEMLFPTEEELVRSCAQHVLESLQLPPADLAPEVFARTFGTADGALELVVLDTTHPATIARTTEELDLERTLFVVASKSGTTTETRSHLAYFWDRVPRGDRFVAITDPGTPLEELGRERGFRWAFRNPEDIGGRYSALSYVGLANLDRVTIVGEGAVLPHAPFRDASRIATLLMLNDWITYLLSGERVAEHSNAGESMLYDVSRRTWSGEILDTLDIPSAILPTLCAPGARAGQGSQPRNRRRQRLATESGVDK